MMHFLLPSHTLIRFINECPHFEHVRCWCVLENVSSMILYKWKHLDCISFSIRSCSFSWSITFWKNALRNSSMGFISSARQEEKSRMKLIKWLGLEVAVEFFNRYLLFPLAFFSVVSIYHSHYPLHNKLISMFITVILFAGALSLEEKGKKKVLSRK